MRSALEVDRTHWPEVWQAAYRLLEQVILPNQLQAWVQPLELMESEVTDGKLRVRFSAPNDFSADWVLDHHRRDVENAFTQVTGHPCEISVGVRDVSASPPGASPGSRAERSPDRSLDRSPDSGMDRSGETGHEEANRGPGLKFQLPSGTRNAADTADIAGINDEDDSPRTMVPPTVVVSGRTMNDNPLDARYNFESFVVGASNQFAHASAVAVSEQPARQYNPLFLYSPPGLGKTHLLHAIGNHLLARKPGARVAYLSAEKFVNELIESLQHRKMSQFRAKYRDTYDMILIDDIQFIAGKSTSEEEFFHTFNALHTSKRQIVVTSDRAPKEIEGLAERIRTRFEWGLIADITPPEIETRIAILRSKAERDDIYLPDEVATFLASCVKTNVRELEGVLVKLQAHASLTGAEISLEIAKAQLKEQVLEEGAHITVEAIQAAVVKHFHIKSPDLRSATRARAVALPRQVAMYLIRKYTGLGLKEIGQYFGGKDHTTILHACAKIEKGLDTDRSIQDAVEAVQNLL